MCRRLIAALAAVTLSVLLIGLPAPAPAQSVVKPGFVEVRAVHDPFPLRVPALVKPGELGIANSTFQFRYTPTPQYGDTCSTWPSQARAALEYAAQIWSTTINSTVPIVVDACWVTNMGPGILGHAGPQNFFYEVPNAPSATMLYSSALADGLAGSDQEAGAPDMYIGLGSSFSWYTGTDGNTPAGLYDMVSIVMHEMAHGLGFLGTMSYSASTYLGSWGWGSGMYTPYDHYALDNSGWQLVNTSYYANPSYLLGQALRSQQVYFHGPAAMAANGGARVKLYAPATWSAGSSYSHVDESFNGTINDLMTYSASDGASQHNIGPVIRGMMQDVGWQLADAPADPPAPTPTPTPTPPNPGSGNPGSVDLNVSLDLPGTVSLGETFSYTISVWNTGSAAATSVIVTSPNAAQLTISSAAASQGSCTQTADALNCALNTIQPGDFVDISIQAGSTIAGEALISATAVANEPDADLSDNSLTDSMLIESTLPDLIGTLSDTFRVKKFSLKGQYVVSWGGAAAGAHTLRVYLSKDKVLDRKDKLIKEAVIPALDADPSASYRVTLKYKSKKKLFGKYLLTLLDFNNEVEEANEANNNYWWALEP